MHAMPLPGSSHHFNALGLRPVPGGWEWYVCRLPGEHLPEADEAPAMQSADALCPHCGADAVHPADGWCSACGLQGEAEGSGDVGDEQLQDLRRTYADQQAVLMQRDRLHALAEAEASDASYHGADNALAVHGEPVALRLGPVHNRVPAHDGALPAHGASSQLAPRATEATAESAAPQNDRYSWRPVGSTADYKRKAAAAAAAADADTAPPPGAAPYADVHDPPATSKRRISHAGGGSTDVTCSSLLRDNPSVVSLAVQTSGAAGGSAEYVPKINPMLYTGDSPFDVDVSPGGALGAAAASSLVGGDEGGARTPEHLSVWSALATPGTASRRDTTAALTAADWSAHGGSAALQPRRTAAAIREQQVDVLAGPKQDGARASGSMPADADLPPATKQNQGIKKKLVKRLNSMRKAVVAGARSAGNAMTRSHSNRSKNSLPSFSKGSPCNSG